MDQLERGQQDQPGGSAMEAQQDTGVATRRGSSRESRNTTGTGSGLASGDAILVDMTRLADVLGCGRDELLHSLRKEATSEAEGIAVDGTRTSPTLDQLDVPAMYPPSGVRQALMTTVSRPANAPGKAEDGEVPRPLWLLGGSGGKTIVELVLLNLVRSGIDRVVIVVGGKDGDKIRDAVSRTRAVSAGKITIEFLEDPTDPSRQFHAKSILRARGAFDSPFLFMTSDHLYHPGLLHQLAGQELGEDGGCVLVEDAAGPSSLRDMAPTAVFVRRAEAGSAAGETAAAENQASRRVMAIGRREQGKRQRWDGVECGAILLSPEIFDTLSDLGKRRKYFTLADGLDFMAGGGMLRSISTGGKPWLALETKAQLRRGNESLVQGLVNQAEPFPWESKAAAPAGNSTTAAAAAAAAIAAAVSTTPEDSAATAAAAAAARHGRHLSLHLDANAQRSDSAAGADPDADTVEDESTAPDFKGFVVPVEAAAPEAVGVPAADDSAFLTRGHALRRRVSLEGVTVQNLEGPDLEAGEAGAGTVSLPWAGDATGDIGFIVSVPGEGGVEELVFAVPEGTKSASAYTGSGGGIFGDCCGGGGGGGGEYADSVDDDGGGGAGGMLGDSDDEEDYNCLHGGILSGCLPELPSEMPSDIQSVRVTTEVLAEKEGEEPTLAVHVIVDRSVPVLGWVLMVSALFGLAAMAPLGDLLSKMSPDALPAIYPVWRYCCSTIMYSPWFLLMVAGSKSARAELRDWSLVMPVVLAGTGLAGWGLCFYSALNFASSSMVALLASLTPMCLVIWRGVTGESVHILEIVGVLLAMVGGVVSTVGETGGDGGVDADVSDAVAGTSVVVVAEDTESSGGQALGILLGLGSACFGGMYILNAKSARNKVEVSHFAFIASIVPAALCTVVLLAAYGGSPEGRVLLFGTSGLFGWTQSPALVLAQIVTSVLGDMVGNFGFYLLLKYISPLVVSLASLTVPLLAVVEGLMLGVVSPPGILFGIGAFLILVGAGTASMVTLLPHTEVFDATEAVKTTNEGVGDADKSPVPDSSLTSSPALGYGSVNGRGGGGGKATSRVQSHNGELRPLLSLEAEDKKAESGSSEQPSLLFK